MVTGATSTSAHASQPKLSATGWASVTSLAILANPRVLRASKTIVFDVQLYLGPTDQDLLIGSLRYFNSANLTFNDQPHLFVIHATFARRESKVNFLVSGNRTPSDYTFVGDIQWVRGPIHEPHHLITFFKLTPLGPPGPRYQLPHEDNAHDGSGVDPDDLPTFTIDPRVRPYIHLTGVAMGCSKADATFEVTVEQYISCFKSKDAGIDLKPATTFFCHIPDSPKYRNWAAKPLPGIKRFVSLCGFLTGVDKSDEGSEVEKFRIDVDNITFCGQYLQPAVNPQSSPVKMPGTSTALFSYDPRVPPTTPSKHSK